MKYYKDKPQGYYYKVRKEMLNYLPETAQKILDIGCGNGASATLVKEKNNAEVWGIELMEEEAKVALNVLDKVLIGAGKSIKRMYNELGYTILKHKGINVTKSMKPILFNIPFLFTQMDIRNVQYATVAIVK